MRIDEAAALIAPGVTAGGEWADLGAGSGTFTRALAQLLGDGGRVLAVDNDARALRDLRDEPRIEAAVGDFHRLDAIPELDGRLFDGILFANSLHFSADADGVIADVARRLRRGGRLIIVEYDGRPASRWVPYPLGRERLAGIAASLGLDAPRPLGERSSRYGGVMYAVSLQNSVQTPEDR